jgi:hypothetical protein
LALRDEQSFDPVGLRNAAGRFRGVNGRGGVNCNVALIPTSWPQTPRRASMERTSLMKNSGVNGAGLICWRQSYMVAAPPDTRKRDKLRL